MCLYIDEKSTAAFKRRHKKNKKIKVYKILVTHTIKNSVLKKKSEARTPFRNTKVMFPWLKAKGNPNIFWGELRGGAIHCFRKKKDALDFCDVNERVFMCEAYTKDFIACCEDTIAFTKIYIPKIQFTRIK